MQVVLERPINKRINACKRDVDANGNRGYKSTNDYNQRRSPGERYEEEDRKKAANKKKSKIIKMFKIVKYANTSS